jgi:hypothetical protein
MLYALLYAAVRRVFRMIGITSEAEVEVLVLRHELSVLRRQIKRPKLRRRDRLFLAAMSRMLARECWTAFFVTPATPDALAPRARLPQVDLQKASSAGTPAHRAPAQDADRAHGKGQPPLGVRAHQGRASGLGAHRVGHGDPIDPSTRRSGARAAPGRSHLASVPFTPKPRASSPATSSRSKRCSSRPFMCWCSCISRAAGSSGSG